MPTNKTTIYKGIPASYGKFYGKALKIISSNHIILQTLVDEKKVKGEVARFLKAPPWKNKKRIRNNHR
jgi:phosphoenolpyruvate-protein kinase (PTS system EI component)